MTEPAAPSEAAVPGEAATPGDRALREPTPRWRRLPDRIDPCDYVESIPDDPVPSVPPPAGDPDTAWMLRYAG